MNLRRYLKFLQGSADKHPMDRQARTPWLRIGWSLLCLMLPAAAQRYNFQTFGFDDGLKNLAIERILQDREGFLWVATQNGLFRFD